MKKPDGWPPSSGPGTTPSVRSLVRSFRHGSAGLIRNNFVFFPSGAMFTDAVAKWTALMLLRFRYRLVEATEEFAEEIVLAAFERSSNGLGWLEPYATAGRELAEKALPKANISREERTTNVERALGLEVVGRLLDRHADVLGNPGGHPPGKLRVRVDPGANGRAPEGELA